MPLPNLSIQQQEFRRDRLVGSNADPFAIQIPYDLTGATAVCSAWLTETEAQVITNAPCVPSVITVTPPLGTVTWAPSIADLALEGDYLLLFTITLQGGAVLERGFFRFGLRRKGPPFN